MAGRLQTLPLVYHLVYREGTWKVDKLLLKETLQVVYRPDHI